MLTRRRFLVTTSAATAWNVAGNCAEAPALPAVITALHNRRAEAQPISLGERESRLEHARSLMHVNQIDAIVLAGGTSLTYFTGIRWGNSERLFTFVLPQKGHAFYVCPAFEEDRVREQTNQAPANRESRILAWQEDNDPYSVVAQALREAGIATGRLGIEERVPFVFSEGIQKAARNLDLISATPVTAGCRGIKSSAELKLMQLANDITLQVYEAAWKSLKPGMTNNEFSELIAAGYRQTGFSGDASCQVNAWSALPHGSILPQVIREGSIVLIDDGCVVEGYQSDISRTFVAGKATDKMKRVFDTVHKAQLAALNAAKPGAPCQSVDAAARKVVDDAGFGPGYTHFTHRVGHGIGMDGHEWPYLVKGNAQPCRRT
jgi:Xaa-Pro dipeptidase